MSSNFKHIAESIPSWLLDKSIRTAKTVGVVTTSIVNKTPDVIADIKDAYKEGREETIPTQLDLFEDQPSRTMEKDIDPETGQPSITLKSLLEKNEEKRR